jgi:tetratricopeptide (TPR) repeat protein
LMSEVTSPQALEKEGKKAYQRGDYLAAAKAFEAAAQGFEAASDVLNTAEMTNNASVAYLQAGEPETALKIVENTPAVFGLAGDLRREGMAYGNLGAALEALNRYDEALVAYQHSADLLEKASEDQLRANVMQSRSSLLFKLGRQMEAVVTMQQGLEGVRKPGIKQKLLQRLLSMPMNVLGSKKP